VSSAPDQLSLDTGSASAREVLIVNVDAAERAADEAPESRYRMRIVRPRNAPTAPPDREGDGGELTTVMILRDATPARVASCIRAATADRGGVSPEALSQLRAAHHARGIGPVEPQLAEREYEVLRMLAEGESTRGIAERLSYSERTVKNIVHDLLITLKCKTRAHAVALAAREGMI
jgi:DNA-binding CsgD family transcriptional regulator